LRRRVDVDGCNNFRDLGGYPVAGGRSLRWRVLYRADALHRLTPAGVARLRDDLGLCEIVDLRSSGELAHDGRGLLEREPLHFHHLPLFDGDVGGAREMADAATLADRYFMMLEFAGGPIARVIATLAAASGPAVFHCAAGKDRTGVISAVLLSLLGVRDELIVADYAASRDALDAIVERLMESEGYRQMFETLPPDTLHAEPATMEALLARVRDKYGSMRGYAEAIGLDASTLAGLEMRLVEG
jgi:protein-tyrosine phosphatase